jgi:RNA polymerase sigma-70 factor (ECF subfamily)
MSATPTGTTARQRAVLDAARGGDEGAYERLVEPFRRELHAHCYRMLGSVHDAEDALQEALLRAWRGLPGFEGRSSLRTWLHRITTNVCLALIERRSRRALPVDHGPPSDPHGEADWSVVEALSMEPYPDGAIGVEAGFAAPDARYERRESVELAFVAALQHLPATQRAVLILRDVLGFSAREVASSLGTSVASVTSALQRARRSVEERLPARSQQANLRALGDARLQALVEAYVEAWERGDAAAILAMLAEDATLSMPPYPVWYRGHDDIAVFLADPLRERWRLVPTRANGQVAFGCYMWDAEAGCYGANSIDVLTLRGDTVEHVTAFLLADALPRFGLPGHLPAGKPGR